MVAIATKTLLAVAGATTLALNSGFIARPPMVPSTTTTNARSVFRQATNPIPKMTSDGSADGNRIFLEGVFALPDIGGEYDLDTPEEELVEPEKETDDERILKKLIACGQFRDADLSKFEAYFRNREFAGFYYKNLVSKVNGLDIARMDIYEKKHKVFKYELSSEKPSKKLWDALLEANSALKKLIPDKYKNNDENNSSA